MSSHSQQVSQNVVALGAESRPSTPAPRRLIEGVQVDQSCVGRAEPTCIEVEGRKVRLEVDVEPLAPCSLCVTGGAADDLGANPSALPVPAGLGVDQERVVPAVLRDIHERDEGAFGVARRHPAETVRADLVPQAGCRPSAVGLDKLDHLLISDWASPGALEFAGHALKRRARPVCSERHLQPACADAKSSGASGQYAPRWLRHDEPSLWEAR